MNPQTLSQVESTPYFFNARELARLAVYRAAVDAHFYTDQCEPVSVRFSADAGRLLESVRHDRRVAAA